MVNGISHPSGYCSKKTPLRLMNSTTSLIMEGIDGSSRWSVISSLTQQGSRFQTVGSVLQRPPCRCMESFPVYSYTIIIIIIILLFAISQMTERNTFSPLTCLLIIAAEIHWEPLIPFAAINLSANWNKHCLMSETTNSWQTGRLFSAKGQSSAIRSTQVVQAAGEEEREAEVCFLPELRCLRHNLKHGWTLALACWKCKSACFCLADVSGISQSFIGFTDLSLETCMQSKILGGNWKKKTHVWQLWTLFRSATAEGSGIKSW